MYVFFFFQATDGIRDYDVTGVQTCALPISPNIVVSSSGIAFSCTYCTKPRSSMNIMSNGINVFRIQNRIVCGFGYTNNIPENVPSFSRFINPSARVSGESTISEENLTELFPDRISTLSAAHSGAAITGDTPNKSANNITKRKILRALGYHMIPRLNFANHFTTRTGNYTYRYSLARL